MTELRLFYCLFGQILQFNRKPRRHDFLLTLREFIREGRVLMIAWLHLFNEI